jgi:ribosome-associated translation inhibitor RaiA
MYRDIYKKMVTLEIEQQTDPLTFTIDVAITLKNGTQLTKAIHVSKKKETITIPVNSAMSKIDWDPEVNLLFETVD